MAIKRFHNRCFRIPGSPEHRRAPVIEKGGRKSDKNDPKICHNIRLYLQRCLDQAQHRVQNQKACNTQNNGKAPSRTQRKEAFFSKFFIIFLPVEFCKNNGHSITSTIENKDKQIHDAARNTNARKGLRLPLSSHDKRIYGRYRTAAEFPSTRGMVSAISSLRIFPCSRSCVFFISVPLFHTFFRKTQFPSVSTPVPELSGLLQPGHRLCRILSIRSGGYCPFPISIRVPEIIRTIL